MTSLRAERDLARGRRAAARVHASGGSAIAAACAHVEATFTPPMRHSILKDRIAALIAGGAGHAGRGRATVGLPNAILRQRWTVR